MKGHQKCRRYPKRAVKASAIGDPLSVAEVCDGIGEALLHQFGSEVWVRGAISGLSRSANGHVYFTLVDPDEIGGHPTAILGVALFANAKYKVNAILKKSGAVRMEDGIEVSIAGSIEHYASGGRVQLIMTMIDPSFTIGQLAANRDATLRRLAEEGLLEQNGLLPKPLVPLRIALVTSTGSAAEADFLAELAQTGMHFEITMVDVRVQGPEAAPTLIRALRQITFGEVDIVALVRGGGAKTDLVAFDDYGVAAAIAACPVTVVVGVGHEVDRSIADETAAISTKTPTAAAGWIISQVLFFDQRVESATNRLGTLALAELDRATSQWQTSHHRLINGATTAVTTAERLLDRASDRLGSATQRRLLEANHQVETAGLRIRALDPTLVMARGWSITRTAGGKILRSIDDADVGSVLHTHLPDGMLVSRTTEIEPSPDPTGRTPVTEGSL